MNDNILSSTFFVLISALAVAAAVQIVDAEVAADRTAATTLASAQAGTGPAAGEPSSADGLALAELGIITLPEVTITGRRPPEREWIAGTPLDKGATPGMVVG